jgi:hypothetical protein
MRRRARGFKLRIFGERGDDLNHEAEDIFKLLFLKDIQLDIGGLRKRQQAFNLPKKRAVASPFLVLQKNAFDSVLTTHRRARKR